jgi:hypothetical protein
MRAIAIPFLLAAMAIGAAAQTKPAPPPQFKSHSVEPVPESRTQENAPAAPGLSADWSERLLDRHEAIAIEQTRIHVFRLRPGDDLLGSIRAYVKQNHIQAAVVLSSVGSLTQASIRYANQPEAHIHTGHFEIVSITGTVEDGGELIFRFQPARAI